MKLNKILTPPTGKYHRVPTPTTGSWCEPNTEPNAMGVEEEEDSESFFTTRAKNVIPNDKRSLIYKLHTQWETMPYEEIVKSFLALHDINADEIVVNADKTVDIKTDVILNPSISFKAVGTDEHFFPFPLGTINGSFACVALPFTSLRNFPKHVAGDLHINGLNIQDMQGCPEVEGNIHIDRCSRLTSLEGIRNIGGDVLEVSNCVQLRSVDGLHRTCKRIGDGDRVAAVYLENVPAETGYGTFLRIRGIEEINVVPVPSGVEPLLVLINNFFQRDDDDVAAVQDAAFEADLEQYM